MVAMSKNVVMVSAVRSLLEMRVPGCKFQVNPSPTTASSSHCRIFMMQSSSVNVESCDGVCMLSSKAILGTACSLEV